VTHAGTAGRTTGFKRSFAKIDRFAIFDLARMHGLRAGEAFVLLTLTFMSDPLSWEVHETLTVIAEHALVGRNTAKTTIEHLVNIGLVLVLEPFGTGKSDGGRLFILACKDLVVPEARIARGTTPMVLAVLGGATVCKLPVPSSHTIRSDFALLDANHQEKVPFARERGSEVARLRESSEVDENVSTSFVPRCSTCHGPIAGHAFNDHEPEPAIVKSGFEISKPANADLGQVQAWTSDGAPVLDDSDCDRWLASVEVEGLEGGEPW
jgi:hypothetical protein